MSSDRISNIGANPLRTLALAEIANLFTTHASASIARSAHVVHCLNMIRIASVLSPLNAIIFFLLRLIWSDMPRTL
jgi:hypothetical protein